MVRFDLFQSSVSYAEETGDPWFRRSPEDYVVWGVDYSRDENVQFWAAGPKFGLLVSMVWRPGDEVPRWGAEFIGYGPDGLAQVSVLSHTIERACSPVEAAQRLAGSPKFWDWLNSFNLREGAGWVMVLSGELMAL